MTALFGETDTSSLTDTAPADATTVLPPLADPAQAGEPTGASSDGTGPAAATAATAPTGAADDESERAGVMLPLMVFAVLLASPAVYQGLVSHTVPVQVMLERCGAIAVGCLVVSEIARRLLRDPANPGPAGAAEGPDGPGA